MNARQFYDKVVEMRTAQREYFTTKDRDTLVRAKALEAEIDAEIARVTRVLALKDKATEVLKKNNLSRDLIFFSKIH